MHYLLIGSLFKFSTIKYLPSNFYTRPNVMKFRDILNVKNRDILRNTAFSVKLLVNHFKRNGKYLQLFLYLFFKWTRSHIVKLHFLILFVLYSEITWVQQIVRRVKSKILTAETFQQKLIYVQNVVLKSSFYFAWGARND